MKTELVSVIVPVHNVEPFLCRCIDSLINQSYNNIEILLIDDGSTDKSGIICDDYAARDSRVRVLHQDYLGVSDARNKGLAMSNGDYIIFLDSDDEADPDYVGKLYKTLIENDLDIAQCCLVRYKDGKPYNVGPVNEGVRIFTGLQMQPKTFEKDRYYNMVVCGKLYKKSLYDGLSFPVGRIHEDTALIYRLYYNARRVGIIDDYLYYYHFNSQSITERKNNVQRLDGYYILREKFDFYTREGLTDLANITASEYFSCICVCLAQSKNDVVNPKEYFKKAKWFYKKDRKAVMLRAKLAPFKKTIVYLSFCSLYFLRIYGIALNWYKKQFKNGNFLQGELKWIHKTTQDK